MLALFKKMLKHLKFLSFGTPTFIIEPVINILGKSFYIQISCSGIGSALFNSVSTKLSETS